MKNDNFLVNSIEPLASKQQQQQTKLKHLFSWIMAVFITFPGQYLRILEL